MNNTAYTKTHKTIIKLALCGILTAVAVAGSLLQFPVLGSKCAPVQHMVNIFCAVFLGPWYGVASAFIASLLRNLFSLGSLMAFPGSEEAEEQLCPSHPDAYRRGDRHGRSRRSLRVSRLDIPDGKRSRQRRVLRLHRAVSHLDRRRFRDFRNHHIGARTRRRYVEDEKIARMTADLN